MSDALLLGLRAEASALLLASDAQLAGDGTVWSHIASPGVIVRGATTFPMTDATLRNCVAVFSSPDGYPKKVPVDYEHATQNPAALASGQPIPKAGEVVELQYVASAAELNPAQRAQVDAETARRAALGIAQPVDPIGLWARWLPTATALSMVKAREYTDASVVIVFSCKHKTDGRDQGPALISFALTNTPFLDTMLPLAASRSESGSPAAPGQESHTMNKPTLLARLSARLHKPFATEDEAVDAAEERIAQLSRDVAAAAPAVQFLTVIGEQLGTTDTGKALVALSALKAAGEKATADASSARTAAIASLVASTITAHETRIPSVAAREYFTATLTRELEAQDGALDVSKAPIVAVLAQLGVVPVVAGQSSRKDEGTNVTEPIDQIVDRRAKALMDEDAELKATLSRSGFGVAYRAATKKALAELPPEQRAAFTAATTLPKE